MRTNTLTVAAVYLGSVIGTPCSDEARSFAPATAEVTGVPALDLAPPLPPNAECAAPKATWIWCDDFETDRLARYFEYDPASGRFARAKGAGFNGSYGMRSQFAVGRTGAGFLHLAFGKTPQSYFRPVDAGAKVYRNVYWRVFVRYDVGWVGGGGHKMSRATSFASPTSWAQAMVMHVWSGKVRTTRLVIDPASGTDPSAVLRTTKYNDAVNLRWLGSAESAAQIGNAGSLGRWRCVEAQAKLNDPGTANGVAQLWIDGRLEARREGLNFVGALAQYGINAIFLENYWDGGPPANQSRNFDRFVVSTARIGC